MSIQAPEKQEALQPQQVRVDVVAHVQPNKHGLRNKLVVGVLAAAGAIALYSVVEDYIPGLPKLPNIGNPLADLGNNPPKVEVGIVPGTVEVEEEHEASCKGRVGAGISVHGNKDELMGGGEYDKILFGDFQPCGDPIPVHVKKTKNPATGEVIKVDATTNGLMVTQPRVDEVDYRNCAPLRPGDSKKEIDQKIKEWKQKRDTGKKPECDDGFEFSGIYVVGGDAAKVITTGRTGAQIAMASYVPGREIIAMNRDFKGELKQELEARYPGAKVTVSMNGIKERTQAQARQVLDELKDNTYKVEIKKEDGKPVMHVSAPGGGEVTVKVQEVFVDAVEIESIKSEVGQEPARK